jgi:hypothetical protein
MDLKFFSQNKKEKVSLFFFAGNLYSCKAADIAFFFASQYLCDMIVVWQRSDTSRLRGDAIKNA